MFTALNLSDRGADPATFTDTENSQLLGKTPATKPVKTAGAIPSNAVMTVFSVVESSVVYDDYDHHHGLYATEQAARRACDELVGDYLRHNPRAYLVDSDCDDYKIADGSHHTYFNIYEVPVYS